MSRTPNDYEKAVELVLDGLRITDFAAIFYQPSTMVSRRLSALTPIGLGPHRTKLYDVAQASALLVDFPEEVVKKRFRTMASTDLPTRLQKDFWSAQGLRLRYELERKRMWRTPRVQAMVLDILRLVRQSIVLFSDRVETQTDVTHAQREVLQRLCDDLLASVHQAVTEHFKNYHGDNDHDTLDIGDAFITADEDEEEELVPVDYDDL